MTLGSNSQPIGLFDSGIGGLTVLRELLTRLPGESYVFLGDTARLPYGSKSPQTIRQYVLQNISFLKRQNVKAIVVACNTASSVVTDQDDFSIPLFTVIRPGALAAVQATQNKRIGVLGTHATIRGEAYVREIKKHAPDAQVIQQACPLFVPLVEEGLENDSVTLQLAQRYLAPLVKAGIDTLILGCTHYPILKSTLRQALLSLSQENGEKTNHVQLIDSADAIATELTQQLTHLRLIAPSLSKPTRRVFVTDNTSSFQQLGTRLLNPHTIQEFGLVNSQLTE